MTGQGTERRLVTVTDWRSYLDGLAAAIRANAGKPGRVADLVDVAARRIVAENQQAWYDGESAWQLHPRRSER